MFRDISMSLISLVFWLRKTCFDANVSGEFSVSKYQQRKAMNCPDTLLSVTDRYKHNFQAVIRIWNKISLLTFLVKLEDWSCNICKINGFHILISVKLQSLIFFWYLRFNHCCQNDGLRKLITLICLVNFPVLFD